jgi:hypothetical protein
MAIRAFKARRGVDRRLRRLAPLNLKSLLVGILAMLVVVVGVALLLFG